MAHHPPREAAHSQGGPGQARGVLLGVREGRVLSRVLSQPVRVPPRHAGLVGRLASRHAPQDPPRPGHTVGRSGRAGGEGGQIRLQKEGGCKYGTSAGAGGREAPKGWGQESERFRVLHLCRRRVFCGLRADVSAPSVATGHAPAGEANKHECGAARGQVRHHPAAPALQPGAGDLLPPRAVQGEAVPGLLPGQGAQERREKGVPEPVLGTYCGRDGSALQGAQCGGRISVQGERQRGRECAQQEHMEVCTSPERRTGLL
mmetsp:Transcript_22305/g.49653  ORF Transcript_22305/g.49653 Transcript_22305/m.49653 type:complete len:260 (+) Transcript_22305:234-1013(+)